MTRINARAFSLRAIAVVAGLVLMSSSLQAGFIGSSVTAVRLFPDSSTSIGTAGPTSVGAGVEFSDFPGLGMTLDISDSAIDQVYTTPLSTSAFGGLSPITFNGYSLTFSSAPSITGVSVGAGSVTPSAVTFNATQIFVDLKGVGFFGPDTLAAGSPASFLHLDVTFAPESVPMPASAWMGMSLIGAMFVWRQRASVARSA